MKGKSFKPQDFKRVWIFTNDDNPNSKFPQEQLSTIQVAKDATETGIEISLWHLNKSLATTLPNGSVVQIPQPFNFDIFYNKILVVDDEEELMYRTKSGGDEGFDTMMTQIRKKEFKKRRMTTLSASLCGTIPSVHSYHGVSFPP